MTVKMGAVSFLNCHVSCYMLNIEEQLSYIGQLFSVIDRQVLSCLGWHAVSLHHFSDLIRVSCDSRLRCGATLKGSLV